MQNDRHLPLFGPGLGLCPIEDAFERAHAHARATAPHDTTGMLGACPVAHAHLSDLGDPQEEDEPLLDGAELLRAAREPIEWLLMLAQRLAAGDPEEIAAVDRLRAAFHAAVAGRAIGVRMRDVLIVFALLVSALDLQIVHDSVTRSVADGVMALLTYEGVSLAAQLAEIANSMPAIAHQRRTPRSRRGRVPRATPL